MLIKQGWKGLWVAGALVLAVALGACATAPVQQMSDARQAIAAAEQAGAAQEAPAELAVAKQYLHQAEQALNRHDFGSARTSAQRASDAAAGALELSRRANAAKKADAARGSPDSL